MKPKFDLGQSVRLKTDPESDSGKVVKYSYNGESFVYTITSVEVDVKNKRLINGYKHAEESELVPAKDKDE